MVFEKQSRDYSNTFFINLCPTFLRQKDTLQKFEALLKKHEKSSNTNFKNLISNEIDLILSIENHD